MDYLQPTRLLCPWDYPGKDSGVGCHALLQGIFPTRGSNSPLSVSCIGRPQAASLSLVPPGKQPLGWILIWGLRLQSLWTGGSLQGRMYHLRGCGDRLGGL